MTVIGALLAMASMLLIVVVFAAIAEDPHGGGAGKMLTLWGLMAFMVVGIGMTIVGLIFTFFR